MNWKRILGKIDEAVFPSNIYCLVCGAMIDASRPYSLCDGCVRKFHWISGAVREDGTVQRVCAKCGKALPSSFRGELCYDCMLHSHHFEKGFSCLTYGLHERELMMDLKYNGKSYIARAMGNILSDRMSGAGLHVDIVLPVPVSRERMRKRGYNQSDLMAKAFMRRQAEGDGAFAETPAYSNRILYRCRETQMLRGLDPAERTFAMDGAFAVTSSKKGSIRGKNILLIDDIYTTGATADACAKALKEAGCNAVYVLTLASGGNRKPPGI